MTKVTGILALLNEDGNSLPGGYQSGDESGIYDYCDHANGQLMLVCLITIQEIKEQL